MQRVENKTIKYRENRNDITQSVEIDLTEINIEDRRDIKRKLDEVRNIYDNILEYDDKSNKLVYKTEVLTPKVNKNRLNILMVFGNPAVHSVAERMFFSYQRTPQGKRKEHRFWRALRDCCVLKFERNVEKPTPENNKYKLNYLLNGKYDSNFNIFLLPYFSFPTPASDKKYGRVAGITKIVGKEIFKEMKEFEFQRFKKIVLSNDIEHVICSQKTNVGKEIVRKTEGKPIGNMLKPNYPIYELGGSLKQVTLYTVPPTRLLHTNKAKEILKCILSSIEKIQEDLKEIY